MLIPLNLQEIFVWYFEQKGVDNPERFLNSAGVNVPLAGSQNSMSNAGGNENPLVNAVESDLAQKKVEIIKHLLPLLINSAEQKSNQKKDITDLLKMIRNKRGNKNEV